MWKRWWNNTKTSTGQTSSEMFLWYIVSRFRDEIDRVLNNKTHLTTKLSLTFRNRTEEVLDIACAELKYEDVTSEIPRLLPTAQQLSDEYFPPFCEWWTAMREQCTSQVTVSKHRSVALLMPGLIASFSNPSVLTDDQWG